MRKPSPNEIYRHFKGNLYKVITLATHTETGEEMVVYQALYGDFPVFVRPLAMFLSPVDKEKYPEAGQEYRFEPVDSIIGQPASGADGSVQKQPASDADGSVQKQPASDAAENAQKQQMVRTDAGEAAELSLDPLVLEFLDADTYEERLNILTALHHRITDDMINTMAVAVDVEVEEGELEERYTALMTCLLTLEKYECNRLR